METDALLTEKPLTQLTPKWQINIDLEMSNLLNFILPAYLKKLEYYNNKTKESWSGDHRYPRIPNFYPETLKALSSKRRGAIIHEW